MLGNTSTARQFLPVTSSPELPFGRSLDSETGQIAYAYNSAIADGHSSCTVLPSAFHRGCFDAFVPVTVAWINSSGACSTASPHDRVGRTGSPNELPKSPALSALSLQNANSMDHDPKRLKSRLESSLVVIRATRPDGVE